MDVEQQTKPVLSVYLVLILACSRNTYGTDCTHNCSGNCLNGEPCNTVNGSCVHCMPGWKNEFCNKSKIRCFIHYMIINSKCFLEKKIVLLNVIYNKIIQKHNFDFAAIIDKETYLI